MNQDQRKPKYGVYDQEHTEPLRLPPATVEPTRDPFGIGLAVAFLIIAIVLGWAAMVHGGWWGLLWAPFTFFAFFGSFGLAQDARKVPRDENGRPLR